MKISDIEVALIHHVGDDLDVADAARVSFEKAASNYSVEQNEKLISYLAKHKHHSPFNHVFLSFKIKAPIFVARQLVKHRFMPWNEVSRRYVDSEPEFYFPEHWRAKAENVKQGSSDHRHEMVIWHGTNGKNGSTDLVDWVAGNTSDQLHLYNTLIEQGVCPEQARAVLPQNTMTEWRWSGTLGAFLDMLVLRLDSHTQVETRIVAEKTAVIVKELFPVSYAAYLGE